MSSGVYRHRREAKRKRRYVQSGPTVYTGHGFGVGTFGSGQFGDLTPTGAPPVRQKRRRLLMGVGR